MTLLSICSLLLLASPALSQYMSCPKGFGLPSGPRYGKPKVADGYKVQVVMNGISRPRSILFDSEGHLLLVASGDGVYSLSVNKTSADSDCWYVGDMTHMIKDPSLNHGLALSMDGKTLLTTSSGDLKSWSFNPKRKSVGFPQTVVTGMDQDGHSTRTILIPKKAPGKVIVSRGSSANIDTQAANITSGHSQLKSFVWTDQNQYGQMFNENGELMAWGLRNSVGVGEDGKGNIWSVENSADNVDRYGIDFHQDNPAEELNFHGDPSKKPADPAPNFGYPNCLAAWNPKDVPQDEGVTTGQQFSNDPQKGESDDDCKNEKKYVRPRLAFQAHMAPLDIKFYNPNTTINETACSSGFGCDHVGNAFVTFHGSWDRDDPVGYKLSYLEFANREPKEKEDSMKAAKDILWNEDNSKCPGRCFRPVGLAFDKFGNLWMTSDATGELWVISRTDKAKSAGGYGSSNTTNGSSTSSTSSTSSSTQDGAASSIRSNSAAMLALVVFLGFLFL